MAAKRGAKQIQEVADVKTRPVRVDLVPTVHKVPGRKPRTRKRAWQRRPKIISEHLGFEDEGK